MDKSQFDKLKSLLANCPRDLDDKCDRFKQCTAEEYKELALHALRTLCKGKGFNVCRTDENGWAAHHITKAIFEETPIDSFDPYADKEFIEVAAALCPWYVRRYTDKE